MENSTKKGIMLGLLLLGCGLTSLLGSMLGSNNNSAAILKLENSRLTEDNNIKKSGKLKQGNMVKIYVSGAVVCPGLYDLPMGARADDAVAAAGGMTKEADATRINLALKLKDGMQVNVPYTKQKYQKQYSNNGANKKNEYSRKADSTTTSNFVGKVNINSATAQELEALPGIGPSMAQKIISYRQQQRFNRVEDLVRVPGIGKAKMERLRDKIYV